MENGWIWKDQVKMDNTPPPATNREIVVTLLFIGLLILGVTRVIALVVNKHYSAAPVAESPILQ